MAVPKVESGLEKDALHLVGIEKGHLTTSILKISRKLTKQDALNKKQPPLTPGKSERRLQFKFLIQEKLDGYKNICQCGDKCFILLLRPFWAPFGVLSGSEELFVFITPQQERIHVVGGVLQTVLVQHPCALGKAHTRQPVVLCHDNFTRLTSAKSTLSAPLSNTSVCAPSRSIW